MSARPNMAQQSHQPIRSIDEVAWMDHALCHGAADHLMFPPPRTPLSQEVRAMCAACPVRAECLRFALQYGEPHGIWGGLTARQRQRLATGTLLPTFHPTCGTTAGYQRHSKRCEKPCARCRRAHNAQMRERRARRRQGATA